MQNISIKKPSRRNNARLSAVLPVRFTQGEKKLIKKAAVREGDYYMTSYMRRVIIESLKKEENLNVLGEP